MKCIFVNKCFFPPPLPRYWSWFQTAFVHQSQNTELKHLVRTPERVRCCSFKCTFVGGRAVCCQTLKSDPVKQVYIMITLWQGLSHCVRLYLISQSICPVARKTKILLLEQQKPSALYSYFHKCGEAKRIQNEEVLKKYTGFCLFYAAVSSLDLLIKYKRNLPWQDISTSHYALCMLP